MKRLTLFCLAVTLCQALVRADAKTSDLDTRGPVINAGMSVQVDHEGVQAPGYVWTTPPAKQSWVAKWIGSNGPQVENSLANCVCKEITLDQTPKKVTAWVTSRNFLLYINGIPAARGPADAGRDFQGISSKRHFYDCRDLTPLFHKGTNAIAAELIGCNTFVFEAIVEYPDGHTLTIQTDDSWRGIASSYLRNVDLQTVDKTAKKEVKVVEFDAAAEPLGWLMPGFDDSHWPACQIGTAPAETLEISELPPLMEAHYPFFDITRVKGDVKVPDKPFQDGHSVLVNGNGEFIVHFDKIMSGRCGIKVKGGKGTRIELRSNETPAAGGRVYQILLRDGVQTFESRDYYALGVIQVTVHDATEPVEIMDVSADFLSQPVEYRGSFTCSDENLNTLWKSGRWSTQICMITHHLDSPQHQEPISDYGDYLIADLVNYNSMGNNPWLARQDLRKWAWVMENSKYHTFHTSYIFYWLQSLLNYYDYTGDRTLVDELAPNVHAVIDQFSSYLGKNGIISEAPNYMFMDWVTVYDDKDPKIKFACHHPPAVIGQGYMTALFYRALADATRVSKLTNDAAHAEKYENLRKRIAAAYQAELWNPDKGMYRDGKPFVTSVKPEHWLPADVQMESFSVQNNAIAVLHDLAPSADQQSIIDKMMVTKTWDVTPYYMHFVFDSLAHADLFEKYGIDQMHKYKVIPETQTVREMGPDKGDYSHGWIASPTYQMSSKILGITPTSPGFDTLSIRPTLCNLDFARGRVPTPHGNVDVDWQRKDGQLSLKITIPKDTHAVVAVPASNGAKATVTLAGKIIWNNDAPGEPAPGVGKIAKMENAIEIELSPGSYELVRK